MIRKTTESQGGDRLEGNVERITFHSDETGFCVLRVKIPKRREPVTVVGTMSNVVVGEDITAIGDWIMDKAHGRQFKAVKINTAPPESPEGIVKFLGSGLVKGIGPVYAQRLVDTFGTEVFDVIENESAKLQQVEGIGAKRRLRIKESWNATRNTRAIMAFLLSHGVSTRRAFRIFKTYGDDAIENVRDNPYCLARDIRGIGFKTADQIAANLGIGKTDDKRARAGVEYVLHECSRNGHVAYPRQALIDEATRILDIPEDIVEHAIEHGITEARLVLDEDTAAQPLVYNRPLYTAEVELAQTLLKLRTGRHPIPDMKADAALNWAQKQVGLTFADAQRDAIAMALEEKVTVITGGPGVGKTTILNALIRVLAAKDLIIVLAAPTGRAAKRMSEATSRESKTIHRLLAFDPTTGGFKHSKSKPLRGDIFIIDEASMIDLPLMHKLVAAIPSDGALVLVGDIDQLPSVGPGTVLRDLILSDALPVTRLKVVFRQAAESDIITNAHRINDGEFPQTRPQGADSDFYFVEAETPELVLQKMTTLVAKNIPRKFKLDPLQDIQVLTPMQVGLLGARNLNAVLQHALNPEPTTPSKKATSIERFGIIYRIGDKVMQTMNNYDKDVFNGDLGRIEKINETEQELLVHFGAKSVIYDFMELDELIPAFATTIHKSQGSEYPCVVIPVHTTHYKMLQRNLIYTAITRGKQLVLLIGTKKALGIAIRAQEAHLRMGALQERLRNSD